MASINCSVIFIISCLRAENRQKRGGGERVKAVRNHLKVTPAASENETSRIWSEFIMVAVPLVSDIYSHLVQSTQRAFHVKCSIVSVYVPIKFIIQTYIVRNTLTTKQNCVIHSLIFVEPGHLSVLVDVVFWKPLVTVDTPFGQSESHYCTSNVTVLRSGFYSYQF